MGSPDKLKVHGNVFDKYTLDNIDRLSARHLFDEMKSALSIGKEANIFSAANGDEEVILKIYRVQSCNFNKMYDYLKQDSRVVGIKKQRRKVIYAWTRREYRNLMRARDLGVNVPTPIEVIDNILVLEFIGEKETPALQLKDLNFKQLGPSKSKKLFIDVVDYMRKLHKGGLVHGDLSSFNILYHNSKPVFIDFSQSTIKNNFQYEELLDRDVRNISSFFSKKGIETDEESLKKMITS